MKKKLLYFSLYLFPFLGFSQALVWQKSFGGTKNDLAFALQSHSSGGFVIGGAIESTESATFPHANVGMKDFFMMRINDTGDRQFSTSYGGTRNEEVTTISESAGRITMAGYTSSSDFDVSGNHGLTDAWIIRYYNGVVEWKKNYGGTKFDKIAAIKQTTDAGYIFVGYTESNDGDLAYKTTPTTDAWIVKLDATGNILWQKILVANLLDNMPITLAHSVKETDDGGYIIVGSSRENVQDKMYMDLWVSKLDSTGNTQWSKLYGTPDQNDEANSVVQTSDGGFVLLGYTNSLNVLDNVDESKVWVLKLDNNGNIGWDVKLGNSHSTIGRSIIQTTTNDFVVVGDTYSDANDFIGSMDRDYYVAKLNASGTLLWQNKYGGSSTDRAMAVAQSSDGNYVVTGFSDSTDGMITDNRGGFDIWTIKINSN